MKNIIRLWLILIVLINTSFAQKARGWDRQSNYNRMYDVKTATEIKGVVTVIEQIVPLKGMSSGIHLMVRTESGTISVHLGPKWYLDEQDMQFAVNDKVEVKGSKVNIEGKQVIIAREIIKDGKTLKLRDESGIPSWSGGRR